MIETENIKYGIGINADYSVLALDTRKVENDSIDCVGESVARDIKQVDIGIQNNFLFSYIAENVKNTISICIDKDTPVFPIDIKAKADTAVAHIQIIIKKGIKTTIHEQITNKNFVGIIIDLQVEEGADVTYIADQRCNDDTYTIALRRAFVHKNAKIKWIDIAIGGAIANSTMYTLLDESGVVGETYGLFYGTDEQLHDISHTTVHRSSYTKSILKTNGVLDNKSKAIYRSLIDIRENAFNADGQQKEETLLLSRDAHVSSVPDLQIANSEVTCSHGVSTRNIDEQTLFYFFSRGIDREVARHAILDGHLSVILDMIEDDSIILRVADAIMQTYDT